MGSSGMKKSRKGGPRQHLPKVTDNSRAAAVHEQQLERDAVLDVMGLGNMGPVTKVIVWAIFGVIAVCAILGLLVLMVG